MFLWFATIEKATKHGKRSKDVQSIYSNVLRGVSAILTVSRTDRFIAGRLRL